MRAYLVGFALAYALVVGVVLYLDEAVRPNNPWVLSFMLSGLLVPVAAGWVGAELAGLLFRRRLLEPGRSSSMRRGLRGLIAGVVGTIAGMVLVCVCRVAWEDYWTMAETAAPASAVVSVIGRCVRLGVCGTCGYDLRGLTIAAAGRCPECGETILA